jgi:2-methylcitrate dehydratase PrpD
MTPITRVLAQFVADQSSAGIPREVKEVAQLAVMDCVASTLTGTREPIAGIVCAYVRGLGSSPQATIIGGDLRAAPQDAAFANGSMAHTTDFDDMSYPAKVHPSVTLVPAALALGEALESSGDDILCAYALGFEVLFRIGRELGAELDQGSWHTTGVFGPLVAAAVAARLLRLDAERTAVAMGIGASGSAGPGAHRGTMARPVHAGLCGRQGITAALLAREGLSGAEEILESPRGGFFQLYGRRGPYDLARVVEGLGDEFALASGGIEFKPYPSVGFNHWAIDAVLELMSRHGFSATDVARVHCATNSQLQVRRLSFDRPTTSLEAKFSMHYSIAAALLHQGVGPADFTDEAIRGSEVRDLIERITFDASPDGGPDDERGDRGLIQVTLHDGRVLTERVQRHPDRLSHPMSAEELADKFRQCASMVMAPADVEESLALFRRFGELGSIGLLMRSLAGPWA